MLELACFLILNIILSRLLEKRMKVASILHTAIFVIIFFLMLFTVDMGIIESLLVKLIGEQNYLLIHESLIYDLTIKNVSISSLLVIEESLIITFAIFLVLCFSRFIKKLIGELKRLTTVYLEEENEEEDHFVLHNIFVCKRLYIEKCCLRI
ncbi:MAG: hypothetical protein J5666_07980 [Bacilli bacterium]|nr:hypothetical protein [Bacilli bacterium]